MKDYYKFFSSPKVSVNVPPSTHLLAAGQASIVEIGNRNKLSKYKKMSIDLKANESLKFGSNLFAFSGK